MKKFFILLNFIAITLSLAAEVVTLGHIQFELDETNHTAALVKVTDIHATEADNAGQTVEIPAEIVQNNQKYAVTSILDNAFSGTRVWKTVIVPKSIKHIGENILADCSIYNVIMFAHFDDYSFLESFNTGRTVWMEAAEIIKAEKRMYELKAQYHFPHLFPLELYKKLEYKNIQIYKCYKGCKFIIAIEFGLNFDLKVSYNGVEVKPDTYEYSSYTSFEYEIRDSECYPGNVIYVDFTVNGESFHLPFLLNSAIEYYMWADDSCGKQCAIEAGCNAPYKSSLWNPDQSGIRVKAIGTDKTQEYFTEELDSEGADVAPVLIDKLVPGQEYELTPFVIYNGHKYYGTEETDTVKTAELYFDISYEAYATKVEIEIVPMYDGSGVADEVGVRLGDGKTPFPPFKADENGKITIKNLEPGVHYSIYPYAVFGENKYVNYKNYRNFTAELNAKISIDRPIGPTTAHGRLIINDVYTPDKDKIEWTVDGKKYYGQEVDFCGLMPGGFQYPVTVRAWSNTMINESYPQIFYSEDRFSTAALEMTPLPAEAVSNTCAILTAETNVNDVETGCGFEWRRYDAPPEMPSTFSPCYLTNGKLAGKLHNLSASTYYKFRPYYKDSNGKIYYGKDAKWIAFITADAYVYFEPMVYTYQAQKVGGTTALLQGYALAGSEEIIEQGFEYWPSMAQSSVNASTANAATTDVKRVTATGQRMQASVSDLIPATNYTFRAFVHCASGYTYGPEMTFTTEEESGIYDIIVEDKAIESAEILGYWNINGVRFDSPQKGFNIIRYSDGTVRKLIIK